MFKEFLIKQGFIKEDGSAKPTEKAHSNGEETPQDMNPVYFPSSGASSTTPQPTTFNENAQAQIPNAYPKLDPASIKFYEDALAKLNMPGPDYFEFRQQLMAMTKKMQGKAGSTPELIFQAVVISFDAQNVSTVKLTDTANSYKAALIQKRDEFLKGAEDERTNQLNKRQAAAQSHVNNIQDIKNKLVALEQQRKQLEDSLAKEQQQMEMDKTLGQDAIEKIERAKTQISMACDYMTSHIDADIRQLQS